MRNTVDVDGAGGSLTTALEERVRSAVSNAEREARRSQMLVGSRRLVHTHGWMLTRCAWCGRVSLGGIWADPEETPGFLPTDLDERTTHGICRSCLGELERSGRSHAIRRS
jgi:hypothetical protein